MKGRRTLYEIYWEVLTFCRTPRTFTSIINRCTLNSKIGQEHVGSLIKKGYIRRYDDEGRTVHRTTVKADGFISAFRDMYMELFNKRPDFKL